MLFFSFENLGLSVQLGALLALVALAPFFSIKEAACLWNPCQLSRKHILLEVGELYEGGFRVEIRAIQLLQILIFYMINLSVN